MGLESSVGEKPALSSGAAACEDFIDIIDNFMIFDFIEISDSKVFDSICCTGIWELCFGFIENTFLRLLNLSQNQRCL